MCYMNKALATSMKVATAALSIKIEEARTEKYESERSCAAHTDQRSSARAHLCSVGRPQQPDAQSCAGRLLRTAARRGDRGQWAVGSAGQCWAVCVPVFMWVRARACVCACA